MVGHRLVGHRHQMTGALAGIWSLRPNLTFSDALCGPGRRAGRTLMTADQRLSGYLAVAPGGIRGQLGPDARRYRDLVETWEWSRS